jgi:putative ABC transport system ATP-binding protein
VASELVVAGMLSAFTKFGKQLEVFYDLCAAIDKLGALVDLPLERTDGDTTLSAQGPARLSMRGLQLQYADSAQPTLNIRSWELAPGERVGVTGPNGSGKSTLADVLFGLRTPTAGSLRVDDVDVRSLSLGDLRRHAALVRDVELFPGTVLDNVRMGRDEIVHADVLGALEAVGLLDELLALPQGLNTDLHPHGRPLSHQQAFRLMVARAIVDRPRLLVLDGVLDRIDLRQDDDRLTATLFAADAPWTLVCVTQRPDVLARCSHAVRVEAGDIRPLQGLAA